MKQCSKCKTEKEDGEFHKKKSGKLYPQCIECHRENVREHYKNNKSYYISKSKDQRKKNSEWFWELKKTLSCEKCGEDHPATLDFHHRNPKEKISEVARMLSDSSLGAIKEEIKKCKVLCSNCHRKLHSKNL